MKEIQRGIIEAARSGHWPSSTLGLETPVTLTFSGRDAGAAIEGPAVL
jgi:hypothetical protein